MASLPEIPINPDLNGEGIDESQVIPGPIMGMRLLLDVALGSEEALRRIRRANAPRGGSRICTWLE